MINERSRRNKQSFYIFVSRKESEIHNQDREKKREKAKKIKRSNSTEKKRATNMC